MASLLLLQLGWRVLLLPASGHFLEALFHPVYQAFLWLVVFVAGWQVAAEAPVRRARQLTVAWLFAATILITVGVDEVVFDRYHLPDSVEHRRAGILRAQAMVGNPIVFGVVTAAPVPMAIGLTASLWRSGGAARAGIFAAGPAALLVAAGSLLGQARSAALGLLAGLAVTTWGLLGVRLRQGAPEWARRTLAATAVVLLAAAIAGLGALFVLAPERILDRWAGYNVSHRGVMLWVSGRMLAEHPLTGVGLFSYAEAAAALVTFRAPESPLAGEFLTAENAILQATVEGGLPAGLLLATVALAPLVRGLRRLGPLTAAEPAAAALLAGALGSQTVLLVAAQMFDLFGWLLLGTLYFALAGLTWGISARAAALPGLRGPG